MKSADRPVAREIIDLLLHGRKTVTARSQYERIAPGADLKIRSVFNPAATDTGRMASAATFLEPSTNLQNLNKKVAGLDPLFNVRSCIVPEKGRMLGEADLSQAEARVAAWMSGDKLAVQQYLDGTDRYRFLGAAVKWGNPDAWKEMSKKDPMRHVGKMGQLAFQYGVAWKTFMDQVNADADLTGVAIDASTAKATEEWFHRLYPGYRVWWERVMNEVCRKGYLVNPFGRKRIFFGRIDGESAYAEMRRKAVAFMPQSTIADLMNSRIEALYTLHDPDLLRILAQVHDAIIFDCLIKDWRKAARIVKETLTCPLEIEGNTLIVPAEVSMSLKSWADMKEVA